MAVMMQTQITECNRFRSDFCHAWQALADRPEQWEDEARDSLLLNG
jgi:hypothetical protein